MKRVFVELELLNLQEYHLLKEGPIPKDVSIWIPPQGASGDQPLSLVYIVIEFSTNVAAAVVAAWLVGHFRKRGAKTIKIERKELIVSKGEIQKVIEEKLLAEEKEAGVDEQG